jgi:hypothetical protein
MNSDIYTMLQNNVIFKHALELAKTPEERKEIEETAHKFVKTMVDVFEQATIAANASTKPLTDETVIVSERTGV